MICVRHYVSVNVIMFWQCNKFIKRILCFKTLTNAKVIHARMVVLVKTWWTGLTAPASPDVWVIPAQQVGPVHITNAVLVETVLSRNKLSHCIIYFIWQERHQYLRRRRMYRTLAYLEFHMDVVTFRYHPQLFISIIPLDYPKFATKCYVKICMRLKYTFCYVCVTLGDYLNILNTLNIGLVFVLTHATHGLLKLNQSQETSWYIIDYTINVVME